MPHATETLQADSGGLEAREATPVLSSAPDDRDTAGHWRAVETLGRRAAHPGNPGRLIDDAAALLAEALDMPLALSAEWDPEAESLQVRLRNCGNSSPEPPRNCGHTRPEPNGSLAAHALASGRLAVAEDLGRDSRFAEPVLRRQGAVSAMAVPLRLGDARFGALAVADRQPRSFAGHERAFANTLGHLAAVTLARWRAEQQLDEHRRLAEGVLETLDAIVFTLDADWRILEANPACRRITGYEPDQLRGRRLWDLFPAPEEAEVLQGVLADLDPESLPLGSEAAVQTASGGRRPIAWSFRKLALAEDDDHRFIATGADLTEQRAAEARAERAEAAASAHAEGAAAGAGHAPEARPGDVPAESPFSPMPSPIHIDRRVKPRRSYPYAQRIAPIVDGTRPGLDEFVEVRCNDIAAGGFSFVSDGPPVSDTYVVALGCPPKVTYLVAQIAHVTRVQQDGQRRFLIGCNYIGRATY